MQLSDEKIYPEGWMLEFLIRDRNGITGNLDKLCKYAGTGIFAKNKVSHESDGVWSSWWPAEIEGNWREAYIHLAFSLNDKDMIDNSKKYISEILQAQESDGYIGIYKPGERYGNDERNGDLWAQSRAMRCLLLFYHFTNDEVVLESLIRATDLTVKQYGPLAKNRSFFDIPDEDGSKTHGLMIIETILAVYEFAKKPEYIDFCEFLYEDFSKYATSAKFPCYDLSSESAVNPKRPFVGHGPHTCEHLRIPLLLYKATNRDIYYSIFISAFEKLKQNMTLSGSCKSDELIGSYQGNVNDSKSEYNVGKSFPLPEAGYEYCSTTELFLSLLTALHCTEDPSYADHAEWLVMNASMAAKRSDGKAILYLCADNLFEASRRIGTRWDYSPTHEDTAVCCAPNSCKIIPNHLSNMWKKKSDNKIYALFYGPSTYNTMIGNTSVSIKQETAYPFENDIHFNISSQDIFDAEFFFRIPGWCHEVSIYMNGSLIEFETIKKGNGKYACLKREFKDEDDIFIKFACKPRLLTAVDGTTAVAIGSLLFSLDIPANADNYFQYDIKSFNDIDYTPKDDSNWEYTLLYNECCLEDYLIVENNESSKFMWDETPLKIKAKMLTKWSVPEWVNLIPIGCTILRRTTFPFVCETI